ncbi:hypothetical protein DRN84_01785 [Candidatus Geothermarchaeota archaeon]|nr:MAG: hypothetical protein DRN84_01785 [Candidatus Geothermarchaeota archaeon]
MEANLMARYAIVIKNLWKSYNGKTVLSNISIYVNRNEKIGIVGPNGAGKTTLLKIIAGLEDYDAGEVNINGRVGMVFQEDILLPWMNIYENIELGLKYQGVDDKVRRDKVYRIAELLGLTQYLDYYPNMVSGGTRRKTSIARAIVLDPDILLLDEPFTGLDLDTTNTLIKMLSIIPSKLNMTLLIVSHQFQELLQIVDRLYILGGVPSKIADEINIRNLGREERIIKVIKAFNMSKT